MPQLHHGDEQLGPEAAEKITILIRTRVGLPVARGSCLNCNRILVVGLPLAELSRLEPGPVKLQLHRSTQQGGPRAAHGFHGGCEGNRLY